VEIIEFSKVFFFSYTANIHALAPGVCNTSTKMCRDRRWYIIFRFEKTLDREQWFSPGVPVAADAAQSNFCAAFSTLSSTPLIFCATDFVLQ